MKETNLSEKINAWNTDSCKVEDVKEAVLRLKGEEKDLEEDVIALIEINNYGKAHLQDLIAKMKRLFKAHNEEKDEIFGEKLI